MQRVLVIRIGRLGDTILATPVIEALLANGHSVSIDFAASPGASAFILEMDERINRVFPIAHRSSPWRLHRVKRELEKLSRECPYDLVINLECGKECDDFIRFVHCREFLGRPLIKPQHQAGRHCVDTEKSIYAGLLGATNTDAAETSLKLTTDSEPLPVAPGEKFIVINPGFSGLTKTGYRTHRGWPEKYWLMLINMITQKSGVAVLVNGTSDEEQYFSSRMQFPGVYSLFGSSLPTLVTALTQADCLVTVDTGTMHLATALATPVVALFGPSNPELTGPYSKKVPHKALVSGLDCQPCVKTAAQKQCTFNRCMAELEPEAVYAACLQVI